MFPETVMRVCFRDVENRGNDISNAAWKKSPSRLLLQTIYAHFSKINGSDEVIESVYKREDFWKAMQRYIEQQLPYSADGSKNTTIVWATIPSKQYYQPGLCLRIRFAAAQLPRAVPYDSDRAASERASFTNSSFNQFSSVQPWDNRLVGYTEEFHQLFCTKAGDSCRQVTAIIIGKLHLYYMIDVLLDLEQKNDKATLLDSTKFMQKLGRKSNNTRSQIDTISAICIAISRRPKQP